MPKASEVSIALRELASRLDREPETSIPTPYVAFSRDYGKDDKEKFLSIARLMPRPAEKKYTDREVRIEYRTSTLTITARMDRSDLCRLIKPAQPAEYECDPLLSHEEDAQLAQEVL